VISMTDTCAAPDLFLDILNGFSWEKVLISSLVH
jgi:hypothetical protein